MLMGAEMLIKYSAAPITSTVVSFRKQAVGGAIGQRICSPITCDSYFSPEPIIINKFNTKSVHFYLHLDLKKS